MLQFSEKLSIKFPSPRYAMVLNKECHHFTYYEKGGMAMWPVESVGWLAPDIFGVLDKWCDDTRCTISPAANVVRYVELCPLPEEVHSVFGEDRDKDKNLPDVPKFPTTNKCTWSFDKEHRVLHADFGGQDGKVEVTATDEEFFLRMCERDDITCIAGGLASQFSPELYDPRKLVASYGHLFLNKVRRFKRGQENDGMYVEMETTYSMKLEDFVRFVDMRETVMMEGESNPSSGSSQQTFTFTDQRRLVHAIPVKDNLFYVIDAEAAMFAPKLMKELEQNFGLPGILPGGEHCLMNAVRSFVPS